MKQVKINGRGYKKVDGVNYYGASVHAPVTNGKKLRIVMVLVLISGWGSRINDMKGAFLKGNLN